MSRTKYDVTPEELLLMPDHGKGFELISGKLVARNVGWRSSWIGGRVHVFLSRYCDAHHAGWVVGGGATYQCFPNEPNTVRRVSVSFVRAERLSADEEPEGHCAISPDLAVEVISPGDLYSRVESKVDEYLQAGTRLVWVVNPPTRSVRVHRSDGSVSDVGENGELDGEDVLPGFRCRVVDLFRTPKQQ